MLAKSFKDNRINPVGHTQKKSSSGIYSCKISQETRMQIKSQVITKTKTGREHHLLQPSRDTPESAAPRRKLSDKDKENSRWGQKYADIFRKHTSTGEQFVDEDFPATLASLFRSDHTRQNLRRYDGEEDFEQSAKLITKWLRPEDIRGGGEDAGWVLIKNPKPSDICQGELGNCWFVAALALIAERKELLSKILVTTEVNGAGVYMLRLFKDGVWKPVIVDSLLPCNSLHKLVFSSCNRRQLWVPLIEKAMAKLHGSYESLQSGSIWDGLNYLTGFVSERIFLKSEEDRELLWGRLLSFYSSGFLMGTSITSNKSVREKGLVANHVYSILQVVCEDGIRLIQLRNPWGRFSWAGDWGDHSDLWTAEMRKKFSPNQSHEGIFWMCYHDFMKYFTCLDVCKVRRHWKTYTFEGILPPFVDLDCQPCFEVSCKTTTCELDISLYQSSKRNSKEIVKLTDIGFMVLEVDGLSLKGYKFIQAVDLAKSEQRRCVTSSLMLTKRRYYIVPFSFGHWAIDKADETFYSFTLTVQSSRELSCSRILLSNFPYLLADAFICCAKKFGSRKQYSMKGKYDDISTITLSLGLGYCTVVENLSSSYVEFQMSSQTSHNYTSTRGTLQTCDKLPPYHSQVVQVLTAKDAKKSSRISNSYQLQLLYDVQGQHSVTGEAEKMQNPSLDQRIMGLHKPRSIRDE